MSSKKKAQAHLVSWIGAQKKTQPTILCCMLLLVLVLPTVKLKASKKQSRSNLWGWRDWMCRQTPSWAELDCRELLPGLHLHPGSVIPLAFPRETLYFLPPWQWFWGAGAVQRPPARQTWGRCIARSWEDHHQQKKAQNITGCLLPALR